MRTRLVLLTGQTVALGLMMAFLVVPASALFLAEYGADNLPYVYLAVAAAGVVVSAGMTRAQRRWSLATVSAGLLVANTVLVAVCWVLLAESSALWVTFPLLVLFPLSIPLGFVVVGTQAGRLLDIRQMKARFPLVVAGFSIGFAVGGLAAAALVSVFGGPRNLLVIDVAASLLFLALVLETARRFPAELGFVPAPIAAANVPDIPAPGPSRGRRLVLLIFGYQVLSAAVTQLLDFMVWERAAVRYPDPNDLAEFLGVFGAIINVVSVAFVALLAGRLLSRFGISLGLAANPAGVLALLVASTVLGAATGVGSLVFFVVVCAQQVTDISLTDGTTRTSINATYQALPVRQRVVAQTRIEGAGVPLALGLVGALLLAYDALGLDILALVLFTLAVTIGWLVLAGLAYREYGVNLRASLVQRAWDPVALRLDDEASRAVVDDLLRSDDLRDVQTGVDVLLEADDPRLAEHLAELVSDREAARQRIGIEAAARSGLDVLARPLRCVAVDEGAPVKLRGFAARVAVALDPRSADLEALAQSDVAPVQMAALAGLSTRPGEAGRAARASCAGALLSGSPDDVRAGLLAVTSAPSPDFVPALTELSARPAVPVELADALAAHADHLVGNADAAWRTGSGTDPSRIRLIRALGSANTSTAVDVLVNHLGDADPELSAAALRALAASGLGVDQRSGDIQAAVDASLLRQAEALDALVVLGDEAPELLRRALRDDARASADTVVDLLGLVRDGAAVGRAVEALGSPQESERALGLESLEVSLGRARAEVIVAGLDPALGDEERLSRLVPVTGTRSRDRADRLRELVEDPGGRWADPWLQACALYALPALLPQEAAELAAGQLSHHDAVVRETAAAVKDAGGAGQTDATR